MSVPAELPALIPEEAAHSARLVARVLEEIEGAAGWIGFARYMTLALYAPGLGYYSAGAHKLGAAGDFVTAPEVAPVFSRCVAMQVAEVLGALGPEAVVFELGAGSGVMAATVLAELERRNAVPREYWILDVSADLRARQRQTLAASIPHLLERVRWLDRLPDDPYVGVVVANEVLDALAVERFAKRGGRVRALGVTSVAGSLAVQEVNAGSTLEGAVRHVEADVGAPLADGYESEINVELPGWLAALATAIERGVMLFIDYGLPRREYYSPERMRGTLLCHFRHRFHDDPFVNLGLQDITAWVDFTAVAEAARDAALEVAGYTTQSHFLIGCGLAEFVADVSGLDLVERINLSRQTMILTLPGEMGERFKVIALAKGYDAPLRGFAMRDLRHTL